MPFFWFIKVIAVILLRKIQTNIHKMTVSNVSETRRDRKKPASDSKSAPQN